LLLDVVIAAQFVVPAKAGTHHHRRQL